MAHILDHAIDTLNQKRLDVMERIEQKSTPIKLANLASFEKAIEVLQRERTNTPGT